MLQEVTVIPGDIYKDYTVYNRKAISKKGDNQIFVTALLSKGDTEEFYLYSPLDWVDNELKFFKGNIIASRVKISNSFTPNVLSVYSPAWHINKERISNVDISEVKLKQNPELFMTEILWEALKHCGTTKTENWIVAGDFNSSLTFDYLWGKKPRGNQEIIDRMRKLGFIETLKSHNGKLVPTFKNPNGGKIIHQIDHMYVDENLFSNLNKSYVGSDFRIFENSISDHLPIISDFIID